MACQCAKTCTRYLLRTHTSDWWNSGIRELFPIQLDTPVYSYSYYRGVYVFIYILIYPLSSDLYSPV